MIHDVLLFNLQSSVSLEYFTFLFIYKVIVIVVVLFNDMYSRQRSQQMDIFSSLLIQTK